MKQVEDSKDEKKTKRRSKPKTPLKKPLGEMTIEEYKEQFGWQGQKFGTQVHN